MRSFRDSGEWNGLGMDYLIAKRGLQDVTRAGTFSDWKNEGKLKQTLKKIASKLSFEVIVKLS
jgi:hypothetical protein